MVKKDKRKSPRDENADEIELPDEVFLALTDFESEAGDVEPVQYTDTSYTSASFESLPSLLPDPEPKHKKAKKITQQSTRDSSVYSEWSEESLPGEPKEEQRRTKNRKKEKRKKHDLDMPRFEKPKNWKEMSKKQRDIWLLEKMEEYKAEKEAEKQAALAGVKERRAAAARERADTAARDDAEQAVRRDLLARTVKLFHKYERQQVALNHKKRLEAEWQQYLRCDGLPDPRAAAQLNTYLHVWRERGACDDDELDRRCEEVLPMLEMLEEFVTDVRQFTSRQIQNYNEVRLELRKQLSSAIHCASYTLLRDIKHRLAWQSIQVATYERQFRGLKLNIYVSVPLPTRKPKPVEPEREAIELSFPSMAATVRLPRAIDGARACVHAAHSALDLLSETCRTHALPATPADRYMDLFTFNEREHENVCKMKKEQDEIRNKFYKEARDRVKEIEAFIKANQYAKNDKEKEEMEALILSEPADMPDPRAHIAEQNDIEFSKYLKSCTMRTRTGEINLRKYRICNGVLNLDLLVTPPQPKLMAGDLAITTSVGRGSRVDVGELCKKHTQERLGQQNDSQLPKQLQRMSYEVQYRAPSPPPPGVTRTPEEIEAEIKRTEAEYEKLALVFIELPHSVMWSEPPVVCQWRRDDNFWTSHYINDYKFNEDKLTVQFRTGVLWPIGIATLRYGNMPYQGWDIKPDTDSKGVLISVTGVCVSVTWLCAGSSVRLKAIANATTPALRDHFDRPYSVRRMMQIMREAACDFFPDFDGHNHVEGSCPKEWAAERHNYHAMAFLARAYNFQWSRWNVAAGSRNIVMQIREAVDRKREGKFHLLHVTPQRATILKCIEVSQEYSAEPLPGLDFHPDLFALNIRWGSVDARRAALTASARLVETVFEMLLELKLSSYS